MKYRYTKYTGDLLDEIDLEDLVSKLSDMLLSSGFRSPWGDPSAGDEDRTMQSRRSSAAASSPRRRCSSSSASPPTAIRKPRVSSSRI
jgi:hypothetical protein